MSAISALALLWWQPIRPTVEGISSDGALAALIPVWAVIILAACAFASAWLTFRAGRAWHRSQQRIGQLAADATRIALGEYGRRAGKPDTPALEPIADALNRLAALTAASESIVADRDHQLSTMRSLGSLAYWETDSDGRFTRVEYEASWPRTRRVQCVGRAQFDGAQPLESASWEAVCEAIAQRRAFRDLPLERLDNQGHSVCVVESARPLFDVEGRFAGYSGITRLMTHDASVRSYTGARVAVQTSSEAMLLISLDSGGGRILRSNVAARKLFERDAVELEGGPIGPLLAGEDALAHCALEQALENHRPLRRTLFVVNRFGERIETLARLEPVPGDRGLAVLVLDAREPTLAILRTRVSREEALHARLAEQAHQLERMMSDAQSFASTLSHDLRAPLRAVDGYARLLLEQHAQRLDAGAQEYLAHILTGCRRIDGMIDAVLTLSHIDHQPLVSIPIDLGRIAAEVLEALAHQEPERRFEAHIGKSLRARGDPILMRIALENLLGNAWKYTVSTQQAVIRFEEANDAPGPRTFCISDNGIGFDMQHVGRLFSPFQRLHAQERVPGNGIGLATVKRIVERHGGSVWAESAPGDGSRFYFRLSAGCGDQEPLAGEPADEATGPTVGESTLRT